MQHLVEAFLLVDQPRQRLSHWTQALGALDSDAAPPLANITAYYDPTTDQALLGLRYDELALGAERLSYVVEVALLAEIGMIQPAELSDGDRRRFLGERIVRCTVQVGDQRGVVGALTELVRRVRREKPSRPPEAEVVRARGTREKLPTPRELLDTRRDPPRQTTLHTRTTATHVVPRGTRAETRHETDPYLPTAAPTLEPLAPTTIYARYLRSGRWVPLRVGALSLKGAALLAVALPRLHDHVDIALAYGAHRALVRGAVAKVSTLEETTQSGAATFSVAFALDDASRRQLVELLTAARAAKVTIKPPPPRATRRFPVEWPISLGTLRGAVRAEALDVSRDGMFVKPAVALGLDTNVNFSAVLEDGGPPISGRARVVRQINELDAKTCGLAPGYGLRVLEMSDADRERWTSFLLRIERRTEKRVLVGAAPERLSELQSGLAAAGYAVTGGADQGALVQLATTAARPVDAVLIDAAWLAPGTTASWVESLFSARNVPCVTMRGDARRARAALDKLLAVV